MFWKPEICKPAMIFNGGGSHDLWKLETNDAKEELRWQCTRCDYGVVAMEDSSFVGGFGRFFPS